MNRGTCGIFSPGLLTTHPRRKGLWDKVELRGKQIPLRVCGGVTSKFALLGKRKKAVGISQGGWGEKLMEAMKRQTKYSRREGGFSSPEFGSG